MIAMLALIVAVVGIVLGAIAVLYLSQRIARERTNVKLIHQYLQTLHDLRSQHGDDYGEGGPPPIT